MAVATDSGERDTMVEMGRGEKGRERRVVGGETRSCSVRK
jgi:hypothetical protein